MDNYTRIIAGGTANIVTPTVSQLDAGIVQLAPLPSDVNNGFLNEMSTAINRASTELYNLIVSAGLTPSNSDLTQVLQALAIKYGSQATESALGVAKIATTAEVAAGTDDTTIITPLKLATKLRNSSYNADRTITQTISNGNALTLPHGLGKIPDLITVWLKCTSAEAGYSVGDIFQYHLLSNTTSTVLCFGFTVVPDETYLNVRYSNSTPVIMNKTTGAAHAIDLTKWVAIFTAFSLT